MTELKDATLARPDTTTEALQVAHHVALTADMQVLQASVDKMSTSQLAMSDDIRGL